MIQVDWQQDSEGNIWLLHCAGHAGFDGELDLVCAAVSALTGALGIGFSKVLQLPCRLEAGDGEFLLQLSQETGAHPEFVSAQTLLQTTVLALTEMIEHYPGFIGRR
ncbi:MAG: ribosomal-processing cysteine protease Prp [Candidatus Eremiobacteraeota bacterium]|nr:ribosomal-processing cysteine protease Prp [Candidatus Eremiobacteraeota bacterium]MCW5869542.1 ribosomal-processing cysteine protease Prp [Candidatus Eremiobacteraeota bacterium]